jgi:hypothetical protein
MTSYDDPNTIRSPRRRLCRDSLELVAITSRPSDHFTQLWPARPGGRPDAPLFLAVMVPFRLAALALLWLTATPGRLVVVLTLVMAAVLAR